VAIVAGFQGVSRGGEITTLGRGGSDTSAVALAVALGAPAVDFYKDVRGIYDQDPKTSPQAMLFPSLSYADALRLTEQGAKVLHPRSVALAEKNGIALHIRSFYEAEEIGTLVGGVAQRAEKVWE
jgi:aspartate kinase